MHNHNSLVIIYLMLVFVTDWRRKWQPTPVFLPGESHGQRSLAGYSPRSRKQSDTTERLHFHFQDLFLAKVKDFSVVFKIV